MTKTAIQIHPDTRLGYVHLTVADLERSLAFYQEALGFQLHRQEEDSACLGAGQTDLLRLTGQPAARRVSRTTGLYHFAILVPTRHALAQSLQRIVETRTAVQGFADHGVSEAIYLADPDGNGIEIYRDRSRDQWPFQNGQLSMVTDPLDVDGLLAELNGYGEPWSGLSLETVLGHVHLHVANIAEAEVFYRDVLGFDLMQRYGPSASFLSAGGYHHHIAINTWAGVGAPPQPADALGMRHFEVTLPDEGELARLMERLARAAVPFDRREEGLLVRDPSGNGILLRPAS